MPLTVHMVSNAHLDPVWLWHWQRGADEALATCSVACDLLDDYADLHYCRGEAWVYEQVRTLAPDLLERIRGHISSGRWEVVNGWWVQPDCNLPTLAAIGASARLGHAWFREHLGLKHIPVAYNVDSFGHGAYLPRAIVDAGQAFYVFTRPGVSEKDLPAHLFRWQSPDGSEVLAYRVPAGYAAWDTATLGNKVRAAIAAKQDGFEHVMCFYGVGNHGGGPTRVLIDWIIDNRHAHDGAELVFSNPGRFFAAVEENRLSAPLVVGELQHHAVGCYSVCATLKRAVRRAELDAVAAEALVAGTPDAAGRADLDEAWRAVCFNQFHDILPGSSVRTAMRVAEAEAGHAQTLLDRLIYKQLRSRFGRQACPDVEGHRVHIVNRCQVRWTGLAEFEAWTDFRPWHHQLETPDGMPVPCQLTRPEQLCIDPGDENGPRLLIPLDLAPGEHRILRIVDAGQPPTSADSGRFSDGVLANGLIRVTFGAPGITAIADFAGNRGLLDVPMELVCLEDTSDTWSHGITRYTGEALAVAAFGQPHLVEDGSFRTTVRMEGHIGSSPAQLLVSVIEGTPAVRVRLRTNYQERFSVLKARIRLGRGISGRSDRVAGGWIGRPFDGAEYPLSHALLLNGSRPDAFGLVLPDSFAVDVDQQEARPTLIRNSANALHNCKGRDLNSIPRLNEYFGTDEGPQDVRFSLVCGASASQDELENILNGDLRAPFMWDDFCGISRVAPYE